MRFICALTVFLCVWYLIPHTQKDHTGRKIFEYLVINLG